MMDGDRYSTYDQQVNKINQFELEAKQGGSKENFEDLLIRIDQFARHWVFFQVWGKITVEEHEELIHKKFKLIKTIDEYCRL